MTIPGSVGETIQLLPWLSGVSRDTGTPVNDPSSFTDLRNIEWFQGAVRVRPGMGDAVNTLDGPVVCSVSVFKAYGILCWVLYDPATRDVSVVQTNLQGQSEVAVGAWGTLDDNAESPPRATMAEAFGVLVFAHDEPNVAARLQSYAFDPSVGTPWFGLTGDLDGMGDNPIYFRGVVTHLNAVWGWGYGTDSDPDRPEVIRRSNPDDPTLYEAETFYQIGVRLDPIIACAPVGDALAIFKGSSWWRLDGQTSADYEASQRDPVIGCVGSHALQNVNGTLYWWSPFGPKSTTGPSTVDLSQPLDLTGPLPAALPTFGPGAYGWTYYDPAVTSLGFAFPNPADPTQARTAAWKVSLVSEPRWSLDVFERVVLCGVLASTGAASIAIDPGYADAVTVTGSSGGGVASASVAWTNVDCVGDETVEIWARMNAGAWFLAASVPVNTHTTPQVATLSSGLTSGTIDVALRHRRLNRYLPAYVDPDPAMWPVGSQATGTIVAIATPVITVHTYDPPTQALTLTWTMATPTADLELELDLRSAEVGQTVGASLVPLRIATEAAGTTTITVTTLGPSGAATIPADQWQAGNIYVTDYLTTARARGVSLRVRIRGVIGGIVGSWSTQQTIFIGYATVPVLSALVFQKASVGLGTQLRWTWVNAADAAGASSVQSLGTMVVAASPRNGPVGGTCDETLNPAHRVLAMDTTGSSPADLDAPSCNTCLLVDQTVTGTAPLMRQVITKTAVVHWTQVSNASPIDLAATCGP